MLPARSISSNQYSPYISYFTNVTYTFLVFSVICYLSLVQQVTIMGHKAVKTRFVSPCEERLEAWDEAKLAYAHISKLN